MKPRKVARPLFTSLLASLPSKQELCIGVQKRVDSVLPIVSRLNIYSTSAQRLHVRWNVSDKKGLDV